MITRVPVPVSGRAPGGATNAYLVERDRTLLVDPAGTDPALDDASPDHVALTHAHPDHLSGVARYEEDATVWARAGREERFAEATGVAPDRTLREGTTIPGTGVSVVETPGHAPDHVAFVAGEGTLVGDLVFAEGSVFVGAVDGDMRAYYASLRRLLVRDTGTLYPGHGDPVPAESARGRLAEQLAHRRDRERRILSAVEGGAHTVSAVLDAAYDGDLGGMRDLAGQTVRAHLDKLAVEGRVDWDGRHVEPA